jgi:hypothetical protein
MAVLSSLGVLDIPVGADWWWPEYLSLDDQPNATDRIIGSTYTPSALTAFHSGGPDLPTSRAIEPSIFFAVAAIRWLMLMKPEVAIWS